MVIGDMLTWWYTTGWRQCFTRARARIEGVLDYFSIGLLLKTLFSPFRQISAGHVTGSLEIQLRAFFDRVISRVIGAVIRLIVIFMGIVALIMTGLITIVIVVMWALVPLLPLVGCGLFLSGWMPWNL